MRNLLEKQIPRLEIDLTKKVVRTLYSVRVLSFARKKPNPLQELPWDTQCGEIIFKELFLLREGLQIWKKF